MYGNLVIYQIDHDHQHGNRYHEKDESYQFEELRV